MISIGNHHIKFNISIKASGEKDGVDRVAIGDVEDQI
jgi:hypothetical protein